jgi:SAM-dependent methyltransferase
MVAVSDRQLQAMLETNIRQKAYYETADGHSPSPGNGFATNLWRTIRARMLDAVPPAARRDIHDVHRHWIGPLTGLKVLELGCGRGTPMSEHLARNSGHYHAIDLSSSSVSALAERLGPLPHVTLHVGDFLGDTFTERGFDLIYAHSVLHHFEHLGVALDRLMSILASSGRVISYDPLQTWAPARLLRSMYRPFQTDRAWEFPFDAEDLEEIERRFTVLERVGLLDRCKWAMVIAAVAPDTGRRLGARWFRSDTRPRRSPAELRSCLHVTYHLQRR